MIQEQRETTYDLIHELEKKAHEKKVHPQEKYPYGPHLSQWNN